MRYGYDVLGRLETVSMVARDGAALLSPELTRYAYDVLGNLDKIEHSNGVISDYVYDTMNRLDTLTHYGPDATPLDLSDNAVLASFDYERYADGMKSGAIETDAQGNVSTFAWDYDNIGRLVRETLLRQGYGGQSYATGYVFDLVGNRLEKNTDRGLDGSIDEGIFYSYDRNDRLLGEQRYEGGVATEETVYGYGPANIGTEQTLKRVLDLLTGEIKAETRLEYNLQGRLSKVTVETYVGGVLAKVVTQEYAYDDDGIKVTQTESVDEDADGVVDVQKLTEYLNDKLNHTGYSQVLEEKVVQDGQTRQTTYTIGHDVLSQFSALNGLLVLLADGHGSTRAVANSLGEILQSYTYDAYGNALNFDPAQALTNLLYSGEQFNPVSGLQYLRARWYSPQTGRFTTVDPFLGNFSDPLSLHKYAYAHMNPVMGMDPTGQFTLIELLVVVAVASILFAAYTFGSISSARPDFRRGMTPRRIAYVEGSLGFWVWAYELFFPIDVWGAVASARRAGHTVDSFRNPDELQMIRILNDYEIVFVYAHGPMPRQDQNLKPFAGWSLGGSLVSPTDAAFGTLRGTPPEWVTANELEMWRVAEKMPVGWMPQMWLIRRHGLIVISAGCNTASNDRLANATRAADFVGFRGAHNPEVTRQCIRFLANVCNGNTPQQAWGLVPQPNYLAYYAAPAQGQ